MTLTMGNKVQHAATRTLEKDLYIKEGSLYYCMCTYIYYIIIYKNLSGKYKQLTMTSHTSQFNAICSSRARS